MQNTFTKYNKDKLKFEVIIDENFVDKYFNLTIANQYESNQWCYNKFINFLFDNIKYSALSAKERNACLNEDFTIVEKSINNSKLILDDKKCGEIGEIALYGVMAKYYGALPVVPKIFYKQNKNDYAKGADSVHIVIENKDNFSLWLGESKFYKDIQKAIDEAIKSRLNGT